MTRYEIAEKGNPIDPYKAPRVGVTVEFYKHDGYWFANMNGLPEDETVMVGKANQFLDAYSGGKDRCVVTIVTGTDAVSCRYKIWLQTEGPLRCGADYKVIVCKDRELKERIMDMKMWLCDCIYYLWTEAPRDLFIV